MTESERGDDVNLPTRECYSISGGYRVRVWSSYLEWPNVGETATSFIDRLHFEYDKEYHQSDFEIELSRHPDGSPKSAMVRLRMTDETKGER
jgi:hypothetical protein